MIVFFLILSAVTKVPIGVFVRLLVGSVIMLAYGYAGEVGLMDAKIAFVPSMAAWSYIIWEIFSGEASKINAELANVHVQKAYKSMLILVTFGWSIYPLGYFFGYFFDAADPGTLNLIYNIADFWNKIAFGLVIWAAAVADSEEKDAKAALAKA